MADGSGGPNAEDIRKKLEWFELRRLREMLPKNGANHNGPVILQPGSTSSELINWPSGGGDDECSPILETVSIDVDWDFQQDPSVSELGLDTYQTAFLSVYWGTVSHRADFDLMRGFSITVSGYKVLVNASYPVMPRVIIQDEPIVVPQPILVLRASLAIGARFYGGICGNARRTIEIGVQAAGNQSVKVEIPPWAKEIGIANTDVTVPTMQINQYANANNAAVARWVGNAGKGSVDTVPRESFSNWLTVTNTSQNTLTTRVIFYLGR